MFINTLFPTDAPFEVSLTDVGRRGRVKSYHTVTHSDITVKGLHALASLWV